MNDLLTVEEFNAILSGWFGRTVSLTPRTKTTSNIGGQETFTNGTPASINCFFIKPDQKWKFDKAGLIEDADAILLAKYADGAKKDDLVIAESLTYIIKEAVNVPGRFDSTTAPTFIYTNCLLKLWNG